MFNAMFGEPIFETICAENGSDANIMGAPQLEYTQEAAAAVSIAISIFWYKIDHVPGEMNKLADSMTQWMRGYRGHTAVTQPARVLSAPNTPDGQSVSGHVRTLPHGPHGKSSAMGKSELLSDHPIAQLVITMAS